MLASRLNKLLSGAWRPQRRQLNLALQGGGAHGAFTWGVLDRLLEDGRIVIGGGSGTSAGGGQPGMVGGGAAPGGARRGPGAPGGFFGAARPAAGLPGLHRP